MTISAILTFFRKIKFFHIAFWSIIFLSLYHQFEERYPKEYLLNIFVVCLTVIDGALCVYSIIYFLVPRYLPERKLGTLVITAFGCVLLFAVFKSAMEDVFFRVAYHRHIFSYEILITSTFIDNAIYSVTFFAIITVPKAYRAEQQNKQLEKERLETELNFLKAQINPHFLFNSLNSIYVLIKEDGNLAARTLLTFSRLLRYQLYECNVPFVPLEKEVDFLADYLELERLRNGENVKIHFEPSKEVRAIEIAPIILITFVENACKHVSKQVDKDNYVHISLACKDEVLFFCVANTYDATETTDDIKQGGIGLQNVKRRLAIIYPMQHELIIEKQQDIYKVNLKIFFKNEMRSSR
jgi:sensor histidine kinase YesM